MRKTVLIVLWIICTLSCKKEDTDMYAELSQGAWLFLKVEDSKGNIVLDGTSEPKLLFFFTDNNVLKGRMKGKYVFLGNNKLYFQAEIDSLVISGWSATTNDWTYGVLGNFPPRYYQFEAITKNGIQGNISFVENGWNSRFSIHYAEEKTMWFQRY
ncbi:MAG TPA: hypothetical protein PLM55_01820 [Chitinophagales bacterium]|nr:hypothetical protein [Chitinophagales bacterium]